MALRVEMVVNGSMDSNESLQVSHTLETEHCSFSSSKRQVRILCPVILPTADLLFINVTDYLLRRAI